MAKFRVGEIVVLAWAVVPKFARRIGEEFTVTAIGTMGTRYGLIEPADYEITDRDGKTYAADEWQLRKRRPPEEPGSWSEIEKLTNWNPTKREVRA